MNLPRAAGVTVLALVGLGVLVAVALLCHEWWTGRPSRQARQLLEIYQTRPSLPDADNAWFDLHGFGAPAGQDAREAGRERIEWMARALLDPERAGGDPIDSQDSPFGHRSPLMKRLGDACSRRTGQACGEAMKLFVDGAELSTLEPVLAPRYRALLQRAGFARTVEYTADQPLPSYSNVMEAQRLYLLRLQSLARRGDVAGVREALELDQVFWRRMLETSDLLIDKMMAVAGLRQHFAYGVFALRELPAGRMQDAVPESWHAELTPQQRSMWRVMATEYEFASRAVQAAGEDGQFLAEEAQNPLDTLTSRVRWLRSPGRDLNRVAAVYYRVAQDFDVPLDQYLAVREKIGQSARDRLYATNTADYALRIGSVEGMRRAALVTVQLRARAVPARDVAAALAAASLRNPYDGKPFTWSPQENAVIFEAPEQSRYTLAYYY